MDFDHHSLLSPSGKTLALASRQGFICLWDIEREIEITRLPVALPPGYWMQFSPDGKLLAAISENGLMLWNLETGEEMATMPKSASWPGGFSFMTNNGAFAVGNADGTVEVWDLVRKCRTANWKAHKSVTAVAFMPDGHQLVTASQDGTAALWELEPVRVVHRFGRTLNAFFSVCVSLDGKRVAAGTGDGQIKIWDSTTGQELATLRGINDWANPARRAASDFVRSLVFLPPDGNLLLSRTDSEVRLWRAPSWTEIEQAEKRAEVKSE
jgi:WD40 repeat protein